MPSAPKWFFDGIETLQSNRIFEVVKTEHLSPSIRRLRFKGTIETLKFPVGAYLDLRVSDTAVRRYTIAYFDKNKGVFECLVHLHQNGCGSEFIAALKPGDCLMLNKPRGTVRYFEPAFGRYVIFGDETALGLAQSFLPKLKQHNIDYQFLFELAKENKEIPRMLGLDNTTVFPKEGCFKDNDWLSQLPVFQPEENRSKTKYVLVGNVKSAQAIRTVIRSKMKTKITLQGYWLEGKKGL